MPTQSELAAVTATKTSRRAPSDVAKHVALLLPLDKAIERVFPTSVLLVLFRFGTIDYIEKVSLRTVFAKQK
ncbi:MAG: hypothetical protein LH471_09595 [Salinibacterium sp.]|nr:hypothetical protein [Salinibacterium sp.]